MLCPFPSLHKTLWPLFLAWGDEALDDFKLDVFVHGLQTRGVSGKSQAGQVQQLDKEGVFHGGVLSGGGFLGLCGSGRVVNANSGIGGRVHNGRVEQVTVSQVAARETELEPFR